MIKSITNFLIIFCIFQQLKSQISQIDQNGVNPFCDETSYIHIHLQKSFFIVCRGIFAFSKNYWDEVLGILGDFIFRERIRKFSLNFLQCTQVINAPYKTMKVFFPQPARLLGNCPILASGLECIETSLHEYEYIRLMSVGLQWTYTDN